MTPDSPSDRERPRTLALLDRLKPSEWLDDADERAPLPRIGRGRGPKADAAGREGLRRAASDRARALRERAIFWTTIGSVVLAGVGAVGINVELGALGPWMELAFGAGLLLAGASILLSRRVDTYRVLYRDITGGSRYDQLRYWTRFKAAGMFLHLLSGIAVAMLVVAVASRVGVVDVGELPYDPVFRGMAFLGFVLVASIAVAHHFSLRTPTERRGAPSGLEGLFFAGTLAGTFAFGLLGLALGGRELDVVLTRLTEADTPFFLLASGAMASAALYVSRSPPTLSLLFVDEREFYRGHVYLSKTKSVMLPVMMAFALLFIVLLGVLVFGLGVANLFEDIPQNTLLIGVLGIVLAALLTTIGVTVTLQRTEEDSLLYRERMTVETRTELVILGVSAAATTALFAISAALAITGGPVLGMEGHRWLDLLALGLLAALGPYGFHVAHEAKRIRLLEARFPDFLRDISASHRSGLTLETAVKIASKGDYGELTPDIVKMADQLSWNVPFSEALHRFAERVDTPLVHRAVSLVEEADRTGGNVTDVLTAAARDARELKNLEDERRTNMTLYTAIIYIVFGVFLAVTAIMFGTFIPEIIRSVEAVQQVGASRSISGISFNLLTLIEYRTFYFIAALVQAVGNGMIAGLIETGRYSGGLRHAAIMVAVTLVVFGILLA